MSNHQMLPAAPIVLALGLPGAILLYVFCKDIVRDQGKGLLSLYAFSKEAVLFYYIISVMGILYCFHPGANVSIVNNGTLQALNLVFLLSFLSFGRIGSLQRYIRFIFIISLLAYFVTVILDVVYVDLFTRVTGRAAGFAVNPNTGAFTLVLLLILSLDWNRLRVADMLLCCITAIGVFVTFSRGGLVICSFTIAAYVCSAILKVRSGERLKHVVKLLVCSLLVYVSIAAGFALMGGSRFFSVFDGKERLENVLGFVQGQDDAVLQDSRVYLAEQYYQHALKSPIFGYGTGYSDSQPIGPHNLYLLLWSDYGIVGLLVVAYACFRLLSFFFRQKETRGVVFVLIFAIEGFFNDDILMFRPFIISLAFLCIAAYYKANPPQDLHEVVERHAKKSTVYASVLERWRSRTRPADSVEALGSGKV
jgi:O-antigen ligase